MVGENSIFGRYECFIHLLNFDLADLNDLTKENVLNIFIFFNPAAFYFWMYSNIFNYQF